MSEPGKTRRELLSCLAGCAGTLCACRGPATISAGSADGGHAADVSLRIAPLQWEVAPGRIVHTVAYNGVIPGPIVRFREGQPSTVEIVNDTGTPEYVHWHGFEVGADVDGAEEERSLVVPAHGRLRYRLTPQPSGSRFVHTHAMAMSDLSRGVFGGQFAFAWVEPRNNPGRYDQEVFLATHEWEPYVTGGDEDEEDEDAHHHRPSPGKDAEGHDWEVGYRCFTINGKCLGSGEPIRVREGQHVLFHFLNASATESVRFALPGHRFRVIALDGNPVPHPESVEVLELGTAERVDAVVAMDAPGVFILGTPSNRRREKGMGVVVEYANASGKPRWTGPIDRSWDYAMFGERRVEPKPDAVVPLVIRKAVTSQPGFERWTINGKSYDASNPPTKLARGKRHRLVFDNQTEDPHPLHLHRCSFELTNIGGTPTSGIMKDVVVVKSHQKVEVDVTPRLGGLTLFHCHQQVHMDNGFKLLFDVV